MSRRQWLQHCKAHRTGFHHGEDPREILRPSRAQSYECKVISPDDAKRNAFDFGNFSFSH